MRLEHSQQMFGILKDGVRVHNIHTDTFGTFDVTDEHGNTYHVTFIPKGVSTPMAKKQYQAEPILSESEIAEFGELTQVQGSLVWDGDTPIIVGEVSEMDTDGIFFDRWFRVKYETIQEV